jgi:hypothetical protein
MVNMGEFVKIASSHPLESSPRHNPDLLLVSEKHACKEPLESTEDTETKILCWPRGSIDRVFSEKLPNERLSACGSTSEEPVPDIDEKS